MHSSQNEQDSRHHAIESKVPMVEPADSGECRDFMKLAFELSEAYDTPVLFRTCTRVAHSQSLVELHDRQEAPLKEYVKNPRKYVMAPGNAIPQHVVVENRTAKLREYGESCPFNRVEMADTKWGVITSGISYQYVKEALPEVSVLKLGLLELMIDTFQIRDEVLPKQGFFVPRHQPGFVPALQLFDEGGQPALVVLPVQLVEILVARVADDKAAVGAD